MKIGWLIFDSDYNTYEFVKTKPDSWHTVIQIVYMEVEQSE